jgi:hypothetical protein
MTIGLGGNLIDTRPQMSFVQETTARGNRIATLSLQRGGPPMDLVRASGLPCRLCTRGEASTG